VPVQDPVPASAKEEAVAAHSVTGIGLVSGALSAANSLGVSWTLLPSLALIAAGALLTVFKAPRKIRRPLLMLGVVLFCFSALRIETAGNKELGAIAKVYSFGWGYGAGIVLSLLMLFTAQFESREFHFSLKNVSAFASDKAIYLVLLALVCAIALINPRFIATDTFINIIQQSSTRLIIAMGMSFVIIGTGGVDLSACRVVGMTAVISASMLQTTDYSRLFYPDLPQLPVICRSCCGERSAAVRPAQRLHRRQAERSALHRHAGHHGHRLRRDLHLLQPPPQQQSAHRRLREDFTYLAPARYNGFIPVIGIIALIVCIAVWFLQNKTCSARRVRHRRQPRGARVSGIT
jgi:methyl-galactoside transport system permease protein